MNIAVATDGIRVPRATSGLVLDLDLITMAGGRLGMKPLGRMDVTPERL